MIAVYVWVDQTASHHRVTYECSDYGELIWCYRLDRVIYVRGPLGN